MLNVMEHNGIRGYIEYVPYSNEFQVKTLSLTHNFFVTGKSADELKQNFAKECEAYISQCQETSTPVFKATYGTINSINIPPRLHEMAILECKSKDISIDELIEKSLNKYFNIIY